MKIEASTLQFNYPDVAGAIKFYTQLFGRPADFVSSSDFQEWELYPNFWIQITTGDLRENSMRLRFEVENVEEAKELLEADLNLDVGDRFYTPNVVLLYNFTDPWGYRLGIFQDLQKYPL